MNQNNQPGDSSLNISVNVPVYVEQMAQLIALPIDSAYHEGTIANFERIYAIALPLLEYPLPETVEPAPVFRPDFRPDL